MYLMAQLIHQVAENVICMDLLNERCAKKVFIREIDGLVLDKRVHGILEL